MDGAKQILYPFLSVVIAVELYSDPSSIDIYIRKKNKKKQGSHQESNLAASDLTTPYNLPLQAIDNPIPVGRSSYSSMGSMKPPFLDS